MLCLGIETSCDETALALVRDGRVLDAELASQADLHALFGGVVPELASREHCRFVGALYDALMARTGLGMADVDVVAVTRGPGLLGSLLVGAAFAKALALGADKPLVAVNHLHAHLLAAELEQEILYPALGLLVSGGHTHIYRMDDPVSLVLLGRTLDDAAGEACDKFAKMLGLPYPGGAVLDRLACRGTADPTLFPRPHVRGPGLDFSFSGLKTAAAHHLQTHPDMVEEGIRIAADAGRQPSSALCDLCASFLCAVADTLRRKLEKALAASPGEYRSLVAAGGVASNTRVRAEVEDLASRAGLRPVLPSRSLCTDNAAMVALAGLRLAERGLGHALGFAAVPRGRRLPDDEGRLHAPFSGVEMF